MILINLCKMKNLIGRVCFSLTMVSAMALGSFANASLAFHEDSLKSVKEYESLARQLYGQKKYELAANYILQAFEIEPTNGELAFSAAILFSKDGKKDLAFLWLEKAKNAGYLDVQSLEQDEDLRLLHEDPRWTKIVGAYEIEKKRLSLFWNSGAWKTPYQEQLSEDQRVAGLSKFWSEVKYNFVYTDKLLSLDWDAVYLAYLPKVRAAKSTFEYYKVLMEMCALLGDGHTNVYAPLEVYKQYFSRAMIKATQIEGKIIVTWVGEPKWEDQGLVPGVEIISINKQAAKEYERSQRAHYTVAATPQDLDVRLYSYQFLAGNIDETIQLGFIDKDGKSHDLTIKRDSAENINKAFRTKPLDYEFKMLSKDVALVTLGSFGDEKYARLYLKDFPEIAKAKAIVFDVRTNGGGSGSIGFRILSTVTGQDFHAARPFMREYKPTDRARGTALSKYTTPHIPIFNSDPKNQFKGEVIVLTSARTFSAAEDFVVAFKSMKRGLVIGEATAGSTGQPLSFDLPGGGSARVCTKEDVFPDGSKFVGIGIQPDIESHQTVADFRAGKDTVLTFALETLKRKLVVH